MSVTLIRKIYVPVICILLRMCCGAVPSFAQQAAGGTVQLHVADTLLRVNNKELKDITVSVKNTTARAFSGYLLFRARKGARVATKDSLAVTIPSGQEIFVPAKIYVSQGTIENNMAVSVRLREAGGAVLDSLNIGLALIASKLLTINVEDENVILPKTGDYLRIPIRVSNRGNVLQAGIVVISFPSALKDKTNRSIHFEIPPFKDTILVFERKVTRDMGRLGYMNVTLNGIYEDDGNIFGSDMISVQNLSSRRSFEETIGEKTLMHPNFITLGVQNAFESGENYYVRSRGDYGIKDGRIAYNLNVNRWKSGSQTLSVNGTNLDIAYKRVGARLGNITQSGGELSFTGRGAELYGFLDSAGGKKVFAGYLDKSINLYTNDQSSGFGNSLWAGYRQEGQSVMSLTTLTHDIDKTTQSRNDLLVSNLTWKTGTRFAVDIKAGAASSTSLTAGGESHASFTSGLNFFGTIIDNVNITGNNAFATAYYPGTRRGTLYLNEGIAWHIRKSTLSTTFIYSDATPRYMNQPSGIMNSNNRNTTGDLSYNLGLGTANVAFSAQYYTETGNWFYDGLVQNGNMQAFRLSALLAYNPVKSQQALYFKTDIGRYRSDLDGKNKLQVRSMLTYSLGNFRLVGNLQKGNFYLSDVFQEYFTGFSSFRVNIAPSITTYFFNRSLKWDAGVAYNRDFYSNSFLFNTNLALITGPVAFFTNVQYNVYSRSHSYRNIQFGVSYFLPDNDPSKARNKNKIELFVFYDLNRNGVYDKTDSVAPGILVNIGKTMLMSGKDGRIIFSKLPPGSYSIYLPSQNGWYGRDRFVNLREKDSRFYAIPLTQTGTIHGSIAYQFDSTYSVSITRDKAWQTVVAMNEDGRRFDTKTDENGNYNLYLPVGTYTVIVENLPNQIELTLSGNNVQPLKVASGQIINNVDFILKVRQRKVEVKKFGQKK